MNARLLAPSTTVQPAGAATPLAAGTRLQEYRLVDVVGQGGFGVVYRAEDLALQRVVAIKEYLPGTLAVRDADGRLAPATPQLAETYAAGLQGFLDEARLLAHFSHPALLEVLRFWQENGTAYLAMPLYPGRTLERLIAEHPQGLAADVLQPMLAPLLDAVEMLHRADCVHRDIAPDNLIVRPDGTLVLLDFGAARRVIGDRVRATTVMLKAGYAPIEQYADDPVFRVGPWSDVYALGAVLHHAITGRAPVVAPMRVMRDTREALAGSARPGFDDAWLRAIDDAMAVRPEGRPQSIAELRERLGGASTVRAYTPPLAVETPVPQARPDDGGPARKRVVVPWVAAVIAFAMLGATVKVWLDSSAGLPASAIVAADPPPADPPKRPAAGAPAGSAAASAVAPVRQASAPRPATSAAPVAVRPGAVVPAARDAAAGPTAREAGTAPRDAGTAPREAGAAPRAAGTASRAAGTVAATGTLRLSIAPSAEVWVDGVKRGVTPPITTLELPAGTRSVQLHTAAGGTVLRSVEVRPGATVELTHRFEVSP